MNIENNEKFVNGVLGLINNTIKGDLNLGNSFTFISYIFSKSKVNVIINYSSFFDFLLFPI